MDKRIAIVGCHGLPPKYGGFETLVNYLASYKPENIRLIVFCDANLYDNKAKTYKGAELHYINLPSTGKKACLYEMFSVLIAAFKSDKVLICGSTSGLILPFLFFFKNKFYLNIGGVEWKRSKYSPFMQKVVRSLMWIAVKSCKHLIADNQGIKEYISKEYKRDDSVVIAYGGDQAKKIPVSKELVQDYSFLKNEYVIAIARIQSDNNVELLLEAFKEAILPLVYIGNWNISTYAKDIRCKYASYKNLILLDAIYDVDKLNVLRSNCRIYIHGHSAGGTNPSLVEAMHLQVPIVCYDNVFNRYVTEDKALYFKNERDLIDIISSQTTASLQNIAVQMKDIANHKYKWSIISKLYYDFMSVG